MFIHVGLRLYTLYRETVTGRVLNTLARDSLLRLLERSTSAPVRGRCGTGL